ncbi:ABC transporter ATP-binding protein [Algoriphagus zhangzhouensis]|uniref:ATP-binding cassette, subfamily B n=1 Tax=Algoriphagus zhangzhouensis TaxID=1073327 RepID=A0A1M7ZIV8_9BACT|nr:ABC transporter ATP-binding protein [Algoriphagus zhangzhouensis]TDY43694.1 ATP-binding cassette subfamily B protein [Algoriphagus zhangzhouensis]SHO64808.1 ATP-binding cassette, subfamily B [Algoriphagus zhangzhouensis]
MKNINILKRLLTSLLPYKWRLTLLIFISIFGVVFTVAKPLPVKIIIDNVLLKQEFPQFISDFFHINNSGQSENDLLIFSLALMVIIVLGEIFLGYISFLLVTKIGIGLVYDLSLELYKKFQSLSMRFYSKNKAGDLLQRFNGDIFVMYLLVGQIVLPLISSVLVLAGMFFVMMLIDTTLAIITISVIPLLVLALFVVNKPMNDSTLEQYSKQGELSGFVQQALVSMRVIQTFVREKFMLGKLDFLALGFKKAYFKAVTIGETYNQTVKLITGLASVVLVGLGAYKGLEGDLSPGDLYVFLGYITAIYGPVTSLSTAAGASVSLAARASRIYDILDSKEEVFEKDNSIDLNEKSCLIEFSDIQFGYNRFQEDEHCVLKQINFKAKPGKVTAIIGTTGAGKTSLISLLGRFYEPWEGQIKINGTPISNFSLVSLRSNISMVLQDPILFPVSIAENIRFGNPNATREQIEMAATLSEAHDFITKLPKGYDTIVSEAGLSLSGGEKQRLSLARTFVMDTPIIVLDEPTSSVDAITEGRIFRRLKDYCKDKTVIVISHRLSTIKNADQILVLKNGSISELGSHEQLIQQKGLYFNLYTQQTIN